MKIVALQDGQTIIDIALQEMGDVERWFELAQANGIGITDLLNAGQTVAAPNPAITKTNIVRVFADRACMPASGISTVEGELFEGIEYWAIENDFIVS